MDALRSVTDWFRIDSDSAVGSVRRAAIRLAEQLGFSEVRAAEVGIVASEISSNGWRHARDGVIGLQTVLRADAAGVQIVSIDRGPGMADALVSGRDGHSTRGSLGVGLGAIERLSTTFQVSSQPGQGTVVVATLWPEDTELPPAPDIAALTRPLEGEEICGDTVGARHTVGEALAVMVADGLGHGPLAATASTEALRVFHDAASSDPADILRAMQAPLGRTRGAAVAVAVVDEEFHRVRFAGIGNVSLFVDDGERRQSGLSQPGIVGHHAPAPRVVELPVTPRSVLVLHSDGVRDGASLRAVPGLIGRPSAVIAATVLRDAGTRPDDASVLVARRPR